MDKIKLRALVLVCIFIFKFSFFSMGQMWTADAGQWAELRPEEGWLLDIRYASKDNFVGHIIYDCGRCFLRPDAAAALGKINKELKKRGLVVKLFDCYRPLAVQWELWKEVPNPQYVADPRKGSMHNRGQAIDVTLVEMESGKELDMGTDFDFFGKRAYHSTTPELPKEIQENRRILKSTMEKYGFQPIRTEWWHYSFRKKTWPIFEKKWKCN